VAFVVAMVMGVIVARIHVIADAIIVVMAMRVARGVCFVLVARDIVAMVVMAMRVARGVCFVLVARVIVAMVVMAMRVARDVCFVLVSRAVVFVIVARIMLLPTPLS